MLRAGWGIGPSLLLGRRLIGQSRPLGSLVRWVWVGGHQALQIEPPGQIKAGGRNQAGSYRSEPWGQNFPEGQS